MSIISSVNSASNNMQNSNDYGIGKKQRSYGDSIRIHEILDDSEKMLLRYLIEMHSVITKDEIDLSKFKNIVEAIIELKRVQEGEYLEALVRPEKSRGCKIPSSIPIPSSSFQLKQSFYVSTNALGNACIIVNPFFLTSDGRSSVYMNNDASLTGTTQSDHFKAINAGQSIPNVYNKYRLVSASMVAKYVGRLDIVQGLIGGAIVFDQHITHSAIGDTNSALAKYGDYNLAQDAFFQQENYSMQGIRELYFPLDVTFEEYHNSGASKDGFGMLIYILGAPPSSNIYKVDLFFNMECLPDVTFLNYIPTSISPASTKGKEEGVRAVQNNPITKEEGMVNTGNSGSKGKEGKGFWEKAIDTLGVVIPPIASLAGLAL